MNYQDVPFYTKPAYQQINEVNKKLIEIRNSNIMKYVNENKEIGEITNINSEKAIIIVKSLSRVLENLNSSIITLNNRIQLRMDAGVSKINFSAISTATAIDTVASQVFSYNDEFTALVNKLKSIFLFSLKSSDIFLLESIYDRFKENYNELIGRIYVTVGNLQIMKPLLTSANTTNYYGQDVIENGNVIVRNPVLHALFYKIDNNIEALDIIIEKINLNN
jgi:hypothetical protein